MQMDKLTAKTKEALESARQACMQAGHQQMTGQHLLLALVDQVGGIAPQVLARAGADMAGLRELLDADLTQEPRVRGGSSDDVYFAPSAKKASGPSTALLPLPGPWRPLLF